MYRTPPAKPRFVVFEQSRNETSRVGDIYGVFTSWNRANTLCKKLQKEHPLKWYGIRQLLSGSLWLKS